MTQVVKVRRGLLLAVSLLLTAGCALVPRGQPLYTGPERPSEQVAWITGHLHSINERVVTWNPAMGTRTGPAYELLPGRHTIVLTADYRDAARWMPEYRMEFEAKAAHLYIAQPGSLSGGPRIVEAAGFRELAYGPAALVGKSVGSAEALPDSSEGQGQAWKIAVSSTSRIEPATAERMFSTGGHGGGLVGIVVHLITATRVMTREERALAGESMVVQTHFAMGQQERWVVGHNPTARGYHLEVGVRLQYLGPDGEVPAPRAWLIGTGGFVLKMLAAAGAPKESAVAAEPALFDWLVSGQDPHASLLMGPAPPRKTRQLRSGENFAETVIRYYFQVLEGVSPDQLWLAVEDLAPLKLPPIGRIH